jgi:hypothetical protein
MWQISSLEKDRRFSDVIIDSNYNIGTFHRLNDKLWWDSIFFVVNSNYVAWFQKYSELYLVNCSPHNLQVSQIQYSPEIMKITDRFILLDDWQNIHWMNIHVVTIFVRSSSKFYAFRDEFVQSIPSIKSYSKGKRVYWSVLEYNRGKVTIEVRWENGKRKNFFIKV